MPVAGAVIGAGGSIASGILGAQAAKEAANAQVNAENQSLQNINASKNTGVGTYNNVYLTDQQALNPYLSAGTGALQSLAGGTAPGGQFNSTPTASQVMANDPGYQFNLEQGQQGLERAEAAGGGVGSGGALKAGEQYVSNYTTNAYQNAYNQFMNTRQSNYGNLANLAGIGQNANNQLLSAGGQYASGVGGLNMDAAQLGANAYSGIGNAEAGGIMGSANAYGGMLSSLANGGSQVANMFPGSSASSNIAATPVSLFGGGLTSPQISLGSLAGAPQPTDSGYQMAAY